MKMLSNLNAEFVKTVLHYDQETGVFTWRLNVNRVKKGQNAGSFDNHGYLKIKINGVGYKAHRLAWLISHGEWPKHEIDHIDRDRANNRLSNLREATRFENSLNQDNRSNTGLAGIRWVGYRVTIKAKGKKFWIGNFDTVEEAQEAYLAASQKYRGGEASA